MNIETKRAANKLLSMVFAALVVPGCTEDTDSEELGHGHDALTAEQCEYFAVNDKVTLCHATSSQKKPYVIITVNVAGCISGHDHHAGDFISLDGTCNNDACYPSGAPVDVGDVCCDNMHVVGDECACLPGYAADSEGLCSDIDECAGGTDNCNDANGTCANTEGSFTCECNAGYAGDGVTCTDIDECALSTDNCDINGTCANTAGSFTCECNAGYEGDGVSCADIDECLGGTDDCDINGTCTNTVGSFSCDCNAGYEGNGVSCLDDNECTLGTDNCDVNATCTNTGGDFTCVCNAGYSGNGVTCVSDCVPPGFLVVSHDINTFTTSLAGANEAKFAVNVANHIAGANGNLLLFRSNTDLTRDWSSVITSALGTAGFSVTVTGNFSTDYTAFDAIFTSCDFPEMTFQNNQSLYQYVQAGGGVYLAGGVGCTAGGIPGAPYEAAGWAAFLSNFGLGFVTTTNNFLTSVGITSSHPLFAGVTGLKCGNGSSILDLGGNAQYGVIQTTGFGGASGGGAYAATAAGYPPACQ